MAHSAKRRSELFRLEDLHAMPEQQIDWWDEIDAEERAEIEEGLAQAERGEVISHKEVMSRYDKWHKK
jgi:predicted transcriptional regulator